MSKPGRAAIIAITLSLYFSSPGLSVTEIPKVVKPIKSIGLTPLVGGYFFASEQSLNATPVYGLKLSYDNIGNSIVDSLGIEATVNYFSTKSKTDAQKADGIIFRTDAIYSIAPRNKWVPFLALGVGGLLIDKNGEKDNSPFLNYGLGIKYFLEDYLALRVDARQLFVYGNVATLNNYELSTGLTYYFGKERKKKGPAAAPKTKPAALPKAVPILDEKQIEEAPAPELPPETIPEKLGAAGPAVIGISTAPPVLQPLPPVTPKFGPARSVQPELPVQIAPPAAVTPAPAPATKAPARVTPPPAPAIPAPAPVAPAPVAPAPVQLPAEPVPTERKTVKQLTVEFHFSSPSVRPVYDRQIAAFATALNAAPKSAVLIEGHTDNVGKVRPNLILSEKRAQNVKNELVRYGVAPNRIAIKGYGFSKPKASNLTSTGRQKNRRAVAIITMINSNGKKAPLKQ